MILRKVYTSFILVGLAAETWGHVEVESEDYFFPLEPVINFCLLSETCQHDFIPVCGQDSLGITRMFSDLCDQYEYNCDEKKQYRHVRMAVCQYEAAEAPKVINQVDEAMYESYDEGQAHEQWPEHDPEADYRSDYRNDYKNDDKGNHNIDHDHHDDAGHKGEHKSEIVEYDAQYA